MGYYAIVYLTTRGNKSFAHTFGIFLFFTIKKEGSCETFTNQTDILADNGGIAVQRNGGGAVRGFRR